jgi:hypothetical protein
VIRGTDQFQGIIMTFSWTLNKIRDLPNPVPWSLISAQVFVSENITRASDDPNVADRSRH